MIWPFRRKPREPEQSPMQLIPTLNFRWKDGVLQQFWFNCPVGTNGDRVNVDLRQLAIDTSLALRLSEFIAEQLAMVMYVPAVAVQNDFAKYLLEHAAELTRAMPSIAVVPADALGKR